MKKIKNSTASYRTEEGPVCKLQELAETYSEISNIPERVGFTKAAEIALLARAYIRLTNPTVKNKKRGVK